MKVVIAGGTGSLGRRLVDDLSSTGHEVVVLTRSSDADLPCRTVRWDGRTIEPWASELDGAMVVNLAGALVDRPPTGKNIALLTSSRVDATTALVHASKESTTVPPLWLQMSTLAIYGDAGEEIIEDGHAPADGPPQMAGVATAWEASVAGAATDRLVILRTGIVLQANTPAMDRLTRITRWGLGGRIGTGRQWVSWIHVDDFRAAIRHVIADQSMTGVVHVTSPEPVRNRDLMAGLRTALHRPWAPPTPRLLVRLGAPVMRTDAALALTGRRCVPTRLLEHGFEFSHPTYADAITTILRSKP